MSFLAVFRYHLCLFWTKSVLRAYQFRDRTTLWAYSSFTSRSPLPQETTINSKLHPQNTPSFLVSKWLQPPLHTTSITSRVSEQKQFSITILQPAPRTLKLTLLDNSLSSSIVILRVIVLLLALTPCLLLAEYTLLSCQFQMSRSTKSTRMLKTSIP